MEPNTVHPEPLDHRDHRGHHQHDHDHDVEDHDRGLLFDLWRLMNRRRALAAIGGAGLGAALLAACGSDGRSASPTSAGSTGSSATAGAATSTSDSAATTTAGTAGSTTTGSTTAGDECVVEIPQETAGPYPGDGSNGANVLGESGVVRSDITASFGSSTTVVDGVPLEVVLSVRDAAACTPLVGAAVYIWHCDPEGRYSMYTEGVTDENFLRGVQATDASGQVRFTTVVPGCYPGRWPHIHFEVFESLDSSTGGRNAAATSQLAFDEGMCTAVYADSRYDGSASNLSRLTLATDGVFGDDGGIHQLATTTGSVDAGYTSALTVGV